MGTWALFKRKRKTVNTFGRRRGLGGGGNGAVFSLDLLRHDDIRDMAIIPRMKGMKFSP